MRYRICVLLTAVFSASPFFTCAAQAGEWAIGEDGKSWSYYYAPGRPAEDEWIEDGGKIYYVDARGYMKTGWVSSKDTGERYYMGEDGAMCFNTFASDGKYVGPDGTDLTVYDTYRKEIRREVQKAQKDWDKAAGFLLTDLNQDDFLDLIVSDRPGTEGQPLLVALWDPEDKSFSEGALFEEDSLEGRRLYVKGENPARLEIYWPQGDLQIFSLEEDGMECEKSLTTQQDQWGGLSYLLDGDEVSRREWDDLRLEAMAESADMIPADYLPLDDESLSQAIDVILTPQEALKWEELE